MIRGDAVDLRVAEAVDAPLVAGWLNDPEFTGEFERFDQVALGRMQKELGGDNEGRWVLVEDRFRLEGRPRSTVFSRGAWRDSLLLSLLRSDWATPRAFLPGRGQ
jgi:hypothetical protein